MADELQADSGGQTGLTAYFVLTNSVGQVWDGSAAAAYSTANRKAGAVLATGRADGSYVADAPVGLPTGVWSLRLYDCAGGSPVTTHAAESDDLVAGPGPLDWSGEAVSSLAKVQAAVYDSVARSGDVLTLSNGATQTISDTGRETAEA